MSFVAAIDISQYQGTIDWTKIGEPIVMMRLSYGDAGLGYDADSSRNYYGAKGVGKHVGCYHFAGGGDPLAEADFFLRGMQPLEPNDVMVLDWEIQHNAPVSWCAAFMQRIHDKCGVWPLLYINLATLNSFDWSPVLANCGLWLADWNNDPDGPAVTSHTYVMQQYNDGPWCDHDAWFGTVEQFDKYGWQPAVEAPQPAPAPAPAPAPVITSTTSSTPPTITVTTSPASVAQSSVPLTRESSAGPGTTPPMGLWERLIHFLLAVIGVSHE